MFIPDLTPSFHSIFLFGNCSHVGRGVPVSLPSISFRMQGHTMTMTILCTPQGNDASGLQAIVVYVQVACIPAFDVTVAIETLLPWAVGVGTVPRVPRVPRLPRGLWACWMILHERKGYLLQYPLGFAIMLGDGEPTPHIAWGSSPSLKPPVSRHSPRKAWPSIPGQTQRR